MSIFSQLVHKHHIPKVFIVFFLISITSTFASYNGIVKAQESDTIICTDTAQEIYGKNADVKQAKELPLALKNINKDLLEAEKMGVKNAEQKKAILELANKRKTLLITLMRHNSSLAYPYFLSESTQLSHGCIEEETTVEGDLEVLHVDYLDNTSEEYYTLTTKDREIIQIHPLGEPQNQLIAGKKIKVKGYKLDHDMLVDMYKLDSVIELSHSPNPPLFAWLSSLVKKAYAAIPDSSGIQQTVVLLINFQNTTPVVTPDVANDVVFTQTKNYYLENSYGKTNLVGNVYGSYTLPLDKTCDMNIVRTEAIKAADVDIDFTQQSRLIIIGQFSGCGWSGLGTIGKSSVPTPDGTASLSTAWIIDSALTQGAVSHEMGHNFGAHHSGYLNCGDVTIAPIGCSYGESSDRYAVMGGLKGHMHAGHKEYIGWFGPNNLLEVTTSGSYVLGPYETATDGLKSLKIFRGPNDFLYLEYRQAIGFDTNIATTGGCYTLDCDIFEGALAHTMQSPIKTSILDMTPPGDDLIRKIALKVGDSFTDPETGNTITTTASSEAGLTVDVTMAPASRLPTIYLTNPLPNTTITDSVQLSASAYDAYGIQKVEFYRSGQATPLATDSTPPYVYTWGTNSLQAGIYTLYAKTYDSLGQGATSEPVTVNVGDSVPTATPTSTPTPSINPDATAPSVSITSPQNNSIVTRGAITSITASASDNVGVQRVVFSTSNGSASTDTSAPYSYAWSVPNTPNKSYTLTATAYDAAGNSTVSQITVKSSR